MISNYDKWLTTPPDDGLDGFDEAVLEKLSEQFWNEQQNKFLVSEQYYKWLDKLCYKASPYNEGRRGQPEKNANQLTFQQCAQILERAYSIYKSKF